MCMPANFNVMGYFIPPRRHTRQGRRGGGGGGGEVAAFAYLPPKKNKRERKPSQNSGKCICWGNEDNSGKVITKCDKFRLFKISVQFSIKIRGNFQLTLQKGSALYASHLACHIAYLLL